MIQRIQSVYLALAAILVSLSLFLPLFGFNTSGAEFFSIDAYSVTNLNSGQTTDAAGRIGLLILIPLTVLTILFTLFQYANRKRQLGFGNFLYLLLAGIIAYLMFFTEWNRPEEMESMSWGYGYFGPIAALPFVFLANRGIKKDEELVKSLDRLR